MSSGMNVEQAKEYAKTMTYSEAVSNVRYSKGIKYRKATMIKLRELAEIADKLDNAPTIEPKQEWIPCSERLPEENSFYLVTADHYRDKAYRSTDMYLFVDGKWDTVHDDIIAWKPLPEPYKEGADDETNCR